MENMEIPFQHGLTKILGNTEIRSSLFILSFCLSRIICFSCMYTFPPNTNSVHAPIFIFLLIQGCHGLSIWISEWYQQKMRSCP